MIHGLLDRGWPAGAAVAVASVLAVSNVELNLWFASGPIAIGFAGAYVITSLAIIARPTVDWLHQAALPLAVLFWGGRAAGFVSLAINNRPDLWGAVLERFAILIAFVTLHLMVARRTGEQPGVPLASFPLERFRQDGPISD